MSSTKGSGVRMEPAVERPPAPPRARLGRPDALIVACLLVLVGFPVMAVRAAKSEPVDPRAPAVPAAVPNGPGGKVRAVPDFTPGASVDRALQGRPPRRAQLDGLIAEAMAPLFDAAQQRRLMRYVRGPGSPPAPGNPGTYPYRYAGLSALVDAAIPAKPSAAEADASADLGGVSCSPPRPTGTPWRAARSPSRCSTARAPAARAGRS